MSNQLKMAEVQAILALARSGWSNRNIARQLGVHRETVGRHIRLSGADPATTQPDSKPASAPTGSSGAPIGLASTALPWREVIVQKLEAGLTAQRIYQDISSDHGYAGSYYSVRRLVKKHRNRSAKPISSPPNCFGSMRARQRSTSYHRDQRLAMVVGRRVRWEILANDASNKGSA